MLTLRRPRSGWPGWWLLVLSVRLSAATVTWDGGGDGVRWLDPANWAGDALPGPADTAVIGAGAVEARVDGPVAVRQATVQRRLRVAAGSLETVDGLTLPGPAAGLHLEAGGVSGPVTIVQAALRVDPPARSANPLDLRGETTLEGNLPEGLSLRVLGSGSGGHAVLRWTVGGTNAGTLTLVSEGGGWTAAVQAVGIALVNEPAGVLEVRRGAGGLRQLQGSLLNRGRVTVEAATTWSVAGAGADFTLAEGRVEVGAGGSLDVLGGRLDWRGGEVAGEGRLAVNNGRVQVGSGVTTAGTLWATGTTVFEGGESPSAEVVVNGNSRFGHAVLTLEARAVNRGLLRLESSDAGWVSRLAAGVHTLSNAPTGRLVFRPGSGGPREFSGALENGGLVEAVAPAGALFQGRYAAAGGRVEGEVSFRASRLSLAGPPSAPHLLLLDGEANELVSDVPAGHTLWVRGGGQGHAVLNCPQTTVLRGTLRLRSVGAGWISQLRLAGPDGARFRWENEGWIEAGAGSGGPRIIEGDLVNRARITVEPAVTLQVRRTGGPRFELAGGEVGPAAEAASPGIFLVQGGEVFLGNGRLAGIVAAVNASLEVPTDAVSGEFWMAGEAARLVTQRSPALAVMVRGGALNAGHARLEVREGAVQAGRLHLESQDAGWISEVWAPAGVTLENLAGGRITAAPGSGGPRRFLLGLRNAGRVEGLEGQALVCVGPYRSLGGIVGAGVRFEGSPVDLTVAPGAGSVFTLVGGASRLVPGVPAGTTVRFLANGGEQQLAVPGPFVNRGVLEIGTEGAGWSTGLAPDGGGAIRNEAGAVFRLSRGAGGVRVIRGPFENLGVAEFEVRGEWTAGLVNREGGVIRAWPAGQALVRGGNGSMRAGSRWPDRRAG
ncbi:MAG: hypothetical protein ACKO3N_03520 [Verrucomicrobiota bacterium]